MPSAAQHSRVIRMAGNSREGDHSEDRDPLDKEWDHIVSRLGELDQSTGGFADDVDLASSAAKQPVQNDKSTPDDGWSASEDGPGAVGPRDWDEPAEVDRDFVPPDPGPIKATDPVIAAAWIVLVVSAIALVCMTFGVVHVSQVWLTASGVLLLASIITLFVRLPSGKDHRDDDDDGAVV